MRAKRPFQKKHRRVGRGRGSGHGKTSTRGQKGGGARSGWRRRWGNEGGQNPYYRRFPKRGFVRPVKTTYDVINLDTLAALGETQVTLELLKTLGRYRGGRDGLKVLARGQLTKPLTVEAHAFSAKAKDEIEKAGGKAIVVPTPAS